MSSRSQCGAHDRAGRSRYVQVQRAGTDSKLRAKVGYFRGQSSFPERRLISVSRMRCKTRRAVPLTAAVAMAETEWVGLVVDNMVKLRCKLASIR